MMATGGDILIPAAGAAIAILLIGVAILGSGKRSHGPLAKRAEKLRRRIRHLGEAPETGAAPSVRRDGADQAASGLERLARRLLPRQAVLRQRLERSGRRISIGSYAAAGLVVALVVVLGLLVVARQPLPLAMAVGVLAGVAGPHMVVTWMIRGRLDRFVALFPDAIDLIVRGVRSGLPVIESVAAVGREMADPIGVEFRRIADSVRFGQTIEDAMWQATGRLDTPEFRFFVISLAIQRETGGNLAETLTNLSDILRRRRQMRLKIKAMSSEARASAMILGSLPFILLGILFLLNPDYISMLFSDPRGRIVLLAGVGIMGIGILIMRKMVRFEI